MALSISKPVTIPYLQQMHFSVINRCLASKVQVDLDKSVESKLHNKEMKPRHQPGAVKAGFVKPPSRIVKGLLMSVGDYPVKTLLKEGLKLNQYIASRHPPVEKHKYIQRLADIKAEIDSKFDSPDISASSEEQLDQFQKKRDAKIEKVLKQRTYAWKPLTYGRYEGLIYMVGRSSLEYAVLRKIMKEIKQRDPSFKPRTFFDFGSGIGTGMWAVSEFWRDYIFEYVNIDSSRDMNDLSELILQQGTETADPYLKNVFYRQYLPAAETSFDLVISAYTLFELPSSQDRKEILLNLWKKCNGYLILVEEGTRQGFELISEARDYVLNLGDEQLEGHVFAPCPHDMECPRLKDIKYNIPCNFEANFEQFPFDGKQTRARYSYVVLTKGKLKDTTDTHWPRIVRPTIVRSGHTICRFCTSSAKLQEIIFTASKHGKLIYRCAKSSRWGDRLPATFTEGEPFDN